MSHLLELRDLHVAFDSYAGTIHAVRGVSFHVDAGETVAIVGESGCGKSVAMKSVLRLNPRPPGRLVGGQILFHGEDLATKSSLEMQKIRGAEIGMIFQDPMTSLNPTMTIGKQVTEMIREHEAVSPADSRRRAMEMFDLVGLEATEDSLDRHPHELSGGMRQRVMIAMALACGPQVLIADEPTTALDVTIQAQILALLKDLKAKTGIAVLLVTHDLGIVADFCDRVVVMYAGEVMEEGTVTQIFQAPKHPYTQALLASVPRLGKGRGERLRSIAGSPPDLLAPPAGCPFHPRCPHAMRVCASQPPAESTDDAGHRTACWLEHPLASAGRRS